MFLSHDRWVEVKTLIAAFWGRSDSLSYLSSQQRKNLPPGALLPRWYKFKEESREARNCSETALERPDNLDNPPSSEAYLPSGLNATSFFYVPRASLPLLFFPSPSPLLNGAYTHKKSLFAFHKFYLQWTDTNF